jgi:hypothetical protein
MILRFTVQAQDQFQFEWTVQTGSPDYDYLYDMDTDAVGNAYFFLYTPWSECHIADSLFYGYGLYITKLDPEGTMVWTSYISCTSNIAPKNLRATPEGEVYLLGVFNETANFGPFTLIDTSLSFVHFLAKLYTDGSFAWAEIVYPSPDFVALDMEIDSDENIYVTGYNPGYYMIIGADTIFGDHGGYKMPLIQFDSIGNPVWGIMTDNSALARGTGLDLDPEGNIIIAGDFKGLKLYFGQDSIVPDQSEDMLLASIKPGVGFNWVKLWGYDGSLYLYDMAVDTAGDIYVTGKMKGDFFFSEDTINIPDFYEQFGLFRFSPEGEFDWHLASTSAENYYANANGHDICLDDQGNLFFSGIFNQVIEIGDFTLATSPPNLNYDNFLIQVSPKGRVLMAESIYGKTYSEDYTERKVDYCGDYLYYSGSFESTGVIGNEQFTSYGLIDNFISKIDLLYVKVPDPGSKNLININIYSHSGRIFINNLSENKNYKLEVLNLAGLIVYEQELQGSQEYSFSLDQSDGIYLVSITDGMVRQSYKFFARNDQ